jgi:hypothetical protein
MHAGETATTVNAAGGHRRKSTEPKEESKREEGGLNPLAAVRLIDWDAAGPDLDALAKALASLQQSDASARRAVRAALTLLNRQIAGVTGAGGAKARVHFASVHDAGYLGLYGMTSGELRDRRGASGGRDLITRMGVRELLANVIRAGLALAGLRRTAVRGVEESRRVHASAGRQARAMVLHWGWGRPEQWSGLLRGTRRAGRTRRPHAAGGGASAN